MLIVNADDWGGWKTATDAAARCYEAGRITSVSAMVHMDDSARGAELAQKSGVPTGLHLNFTQPFTSTDCPAPVKSAQSKTSRFLRRGRYALLVYHPFLRKAFQTVIAGQVAEFRRLYRQEPTHVDGHRHMHLCSNVLLASLLPVGLPVRRSFTFASGEKSLFNRTYRRAVDRRVRRSHRTTDSFFALSQCLGRPRLEHVIRLAETNTIELMTHPENAPEYQCLMSSDFGALLDRVHLGNYREI